MSQTKITYQDMREEMIKHNIDNLLNDKELARGKIRIKMLPCQKETITEYYKFCKGGAEGRMHKLSSVHLAIRNVKKFALWLRKDLKKATRTDIEHFMAHMRESKLSDAYLATMAIRLKTFYKWLYKSDSYPPIVAWLKPQLKVKEIRFEELLTIEEITKMLETKNGKDAESIRDRALLMILVDSGGRIGEILGVCLKDVIADEIGFTLFVDGKTGPRHIRLIESIKYLEEWLDVHPYKKNEEWPLFISLRKMHLRALRVAQVRKIINAMGRMANIKKRVNPHSFRHRRCTQLSIQGLNEIELSKTFGWKPGSSMVARYNHESEQAVHAKILKISGINVKFKQEIEQLKMTRCKCGTEVSPEKSFCPTCNTLVNPIAINKVDRDDEKVMSVKKVLDHGMNDPQTKDKLALLLQEIVNRMSDS